MYYYCTCELGDAIVVGRVNAWEETERDRIIYKKKKKKVKTTRVILLRCSIPSVESENISTHLRENSIATLHTLRQDRTNINNT